jgi:hypothetical protein
MILRVVVRIPSALGCLCEQHKILAPQPPNAGVFIRSGGWSSKGSNNARQRLAARITKSDDGLWPTEIDEQNANVAPRCQVSVIVGIGVNTGRKNKNIKILSGENLFELNLIDGRDNLDGWSCL